MEELLENMEGTEMEIIIHKTFFFIFLSRMIYLWSEFNQVLIDNSY